MDKLPTTIIKPIYMNMKILINSKLIKLHCFMYRCSECFKPYNQCCCYCQTCGTYLRFYKQLYVKDGDMTEDDIIDIVGLGV